MSGLMEILAERNYGMTSALLQSGGFRALLDPHSSEYKCMSEGRRIEFVEFIVKSSVGLFRLRSEFIGLMTQGFGYPCAVAHECYGIAMTTLAERVVSERVKSPLQQLAEQAE